MGVARTVAVLQILETMPVTARNISSLMHPAIDAPSQLEAVEAAIADLRRNPYVPFGEKEGNLCFFSEKLNEIDQERNKLPIRTLETRRIRNEVLREVFTPLPSARLAGSLSVATGLKAQVGSQIDIIAGERMPVQTIVELVDPADYEAARTRLLDESRQRGAPQTIFMLGRTAPEIEEKVNEIYRCEQIAQLHGNNADKEVRDYCASQAERARQLRSDLDSQLRRLLRQGSFIFRGSQTAVDSLDHDLIEATKKHLSGWPPRYSTAIKRPRSRPRPRWPRSSCGSPA
jgi:hypothetical protein